MVYAAWAMANQRRKCQDRHKTTSRMYASIKTKVALELSAMNSGQVSPTKGKKLTEETKRKMSISAAGRKPSPQAMEAVRLARTGVAPSNKGKPMTEEQKQKIRNAALARWSLKNSLVSNEC